MALYPPTIEGQLPPAVLWTNEEKEKVITITIPYEINRGVDPLAIVGYSIRIKNLISDKLLGVFNVFGYQHNNIILEIKDELFISKVNLGDNFKIQVAFGEAVAVENNQQILTNLGYYSTVGICKYMNKPRLNIISSGGGWRGEYVSDQLDELLYSSQFILKDENKEVIEVGEVEIINYLNEEQEQFYEAYFNEVITTQLNTVKELAADEAKNFNDWKSKNSTVSAYNDLIATSFEELEQPKGTGNKTEGNAEIKALSIYKDETVKDLQKKVSNLHQVLQMKNYTEELNQKLLEGISNLKQTYINEIAEANIIGASQGYDENIKDILSKNIKALDKSFNNLIGAIDTQDLSLNGSDKYWKVASDNNYSDYFEAVKKSSKSVFYRFKTQLKLGYKYYVDWHVETSSGYKEVVSEKAIMSDEILAPDYPLVPKVRIDEINGIAEIAIEISENNNTEKNFGHWKILKATSKDNFESWTEMYDIENCYSWYLSPASSFKVVLIKDYDIEHGISYQYALQQINEYGKRSIKIVSPSVNAKFEDIYLCDDTRQLRIAFNPKVSSMKNSILESKQNTIGGKYPYIFRNGNVLYKEFAISGMISYLEDPNNEFKVDFREFSEVNTTNLTNDNIAKERLFKMEVLDWLNNGKPKLLKTATEGNYVVTIMNVSLTPNDTLGRMLHSFNATAVEIQDKDTMVRADLKKLDNERIHIETCIGNSTTAGWGSDREIKEIWIYGSTYMEEDPANVIINGKQYKVGGEGLRLETIEGEKITSYSTEDRGVVADIYYTYKPILIKRDFSKTKDFKVKEFVGRVHSGTDITTPGYYKILTATYHGAPVVDQNDEIRYTTYSDGFDFKDDKRAIYLHYPDHVETLYVVDQLTFSDVWLNKIYCGDNISLTYSKICADEIQMEEEGT